VGPGLEFPYQFVSIVGLLRLFCVDGWLFAYTCELASLLHGTTEPRMQAMTTVADLIFDADVPTEVLPPWSLSVLPT